MIKGAHWLKSIKELPSPGMMSSLALHSLHATARDALNHVDLVQSIFEGAKLCMVAGAKELCRLPLHACPTDG